jgi:hypothetical protein
MAAREALPELKKWMETRQPLEKAKHAHNLVQAATMPAD